MREFTASDGTPMRVEITIGSARRVKDLCQVNLLKPMSLYDEQSIVSALYTDIELFVDVLYVLCVEDPQTCAPEEFARKLPEAWQECRDAFFEEWVDFFLRSGIQDKAGAVQKTLETIKAALQETWDRIQTLDTASHGINAVRGMDFDRMIQEDLNRALSPKQTATPGMKSNASPGSSGSTPIR